MRGELVRILCEVSFVSGRLMQSISATCSTRKYTSQETMFDMLVYKTILVQNRRFGDVNDAQKKIENISYP